MPKRTSKPQRPTRGEHESEHHFQERLRRFEGREPAPTKSSAPGIQKRARSTQSKIQKKNFTLTKNLTKQGDDSLLDVTSSPKKGSGAADVFKTFKISTYNDIIIDNPTRSKGFKTENTRGNRYTTLDEAIERYNVVVFPMTKFYQDSDGYWHSYIMYDDAVEDEELE